MKKILVFTAVALCLSLPVKAFARHDSNSITWASPVIQQQPAQQTLQQLGKNVIHRVFAETEKAVMEEYFGQTINAQTENTQSVADESRHDEYRHKRHHDDDEGDEGDDQDEDGRENHGHDHGRHLGHYKQHKNHGHHDEERELPHGLQKQLERNGYLPHGLEKRRLPAELSKMLPQSPKGTSRYIVGNDVVLVDAKTQLILDVINGIVNR